MFTVVTKTSGSKASDKWGCCGNNVPPKSALFSHREQTDRQWGAHIHCTIDLGSSVVICWKLIDLNTIDDQFTHELHLKLLQFALRNCIGLGN